MQIDKNQIMDLLKSQGHPQTDQANQQLPDQVDTDNSEHKNLLAKLGINPSELTSKLGGLGNIL